MTTFIDTCVLINMTNPSEKFHAWSVSQFQNCKAAGPIIVSDIVYCEFCAGMASRSDVDAVIAQFGLQRLRGSDSALFRAAIAFREYRQRGGIKTNVLPDFLIGAIADIEGVPLITSNPKDYLSYFPGLRIIAPP